MSTARCGSSTATAADCTRCRSRSRSAAAATADPTTHGCANAAWSPDGRKIVFRRTTPGFGEGGDLYTVNADGTGLFQVTHDGDVDSPDWGTHPLARG